MGRRGDFIDTVLCLFFAQQRFGYALQLTRFVFYGWRVGMGSCKTLFFRRRHRVGVFLCFSQRRGEWRRGRREEERRGEDVGDGQQNFDNSVVLYGVCAHHKGLASELGVSQAIESSQILLVRNIGGGCKPNRRPPQKNVADRWRQRAIQHIAA